MAKNNDIYQYLVKRQIGQATTIDFPQQMKIFSNGKMIRDTPEHLREKGKEDNDVVVHAARQKAFLALSTCGKDEYKLKIFTVVIPTWLGKAMFYYTKDYVNMQGMVLIKAQTFEAHADANLDLLCKLQLHLGKADRAKDLYSFTMIEKEAVHNKEAEIEYFFTLPNKTTLLVLPPALYHKFQIFSFMEKAIQSLIAELESLNEDKLRYIWQHAIACNENVNGCRIKDQLDNLIGDFMDILELL